MEYSELITTGECGDRSEPGIFYDGNDLAWRNGVRICKGYCLVNFGCYLVMWANHSQILSEYSSTCRQMRTRMSFSFTSLVTTDHDDEHKKKIECNHAFDLVANSIKQVNNSPQYIQVWKVEWKNMFWHCLIAQVETAKECAKQCADEAQCNGWSHFAPAKRWTHTSYLSRTPRTASV